VFGVGYETGAMMGNFVLDAFDGVHWASGVAPGADALNPNPLVTIERVVPKPGPGGAYAFASVFGDPRTFRLYEVSALLETWTQLAEAEETGDSHALVVTSGGTVVAIDANYMVRGAQTTIVTRSGSQTATCSLSPGLGHTIAVAPPGSPYVH